MGSCLIIRQSSSGVNDITNTFVYCSQSSRSETDVKRVFFTSSSDTNYGWYAGSNGGITTYQLKVQNLKGVNVKFVVGSACIGPESSNKYKVQYATDSNLSNWVDATFENGVWKVDEVVYGINSYLYCPSTSSMHYVTYGVCRIFG